jgi:hypothetical protein
MVAAGPVLTGAAWCKRGAAAPGQQRGAVVWCEVSYLAAPGDVGGELTGSCLTCGPSRP